MRKLRPTETEIIEWIRERYEKKLSLSPHSLRYNPDNARYYYAGYRSGGWREMIRKALGHLGVTYESILNRRASSWYREKHHPKEKKQ